MVAQSNIFFVELSDLIGNVFQQMFVLLVVTELIIVIGGRVLQQQFFPHFFNVYELRQIIAHCYGCY